MVVGMVVVLVVVLICGGTTREREEASCSEAALVSTPRLLLVGSWDSRSSPWVDWSGSCDWFSRLSPASVSSS